ETRRAVVTALVCNAAFAAAVGVVPPLLPAMRGGLGLSDVGAAWIVSAFAMARLVIDLPAGMVLERVGRRRGFVAGGLLLAAGGLLSALAPAPWVLYAGRVLGGLGQAVTSLTLLLFVISALPPSARSRAGSLSEFTTIGSFLLAGLLAGPVSSLAGWRGALALVGFLAAVATWAGARLPWSAASVGSAPPAGAAGKPAEVAEAPSPIAPAIAASFSISLTWNGVMVTLLPLVAASRLGLDATAIGRVLSFNYAADLLLLLPMATLADRTGGGARVLAAALGVAAIAAPAVLLAPSPALLSAAAFAVGATFSAWMLPAALLLRAVPPSGHARTIGLFRFTGDLAAVVGPVAVAAAYQTGGLPLAALLAGAVPLAAALLLVRGGRAARRGTVV
ncbi:MAG TPA: MFS transporter, partial [Thermodesulfobacteriota bacterium]